MPWVLYYEIGTMVVGPAAGPASEQRVVAYLMLQHFFRVFGVTGLYLPGVALVAILLAWHLAAGDKWSLRWQTLGGMAAESFALALPLLIFNQVVAAQPTSQAEVWPFAMVPPPSMMFWELPAPRSE